MKNKLINNYFSKTVFVFTAFVFCILFSSQASAQVLPSYGGRQIMYFPEFICNGAPQINVHFIISGTRLISLYSVPGLTQLHGPATVEFGVTQVGTYIPAPMPCMVIVGTGEVPIWFVDGFYLDASPGYVKGNKFFAGAVDPFIKAIEPEA